MYFGPETPVQKMYRASVKIALFPTGCAALNTGDEINIKTACLIIFRCYIRLC